MKALDMIWRAAKVIGGFSVGAVSVLAWLNVTPEMVGRAVYDVLYVVLPIITFLGGMLAGWGISGRRSKELLAAKDAEIAELLRRPTVEEVDELRRGLAAKEADCERRVFEATMPLDRTISLTKPQAEVVVDMIDRERAGEDTVLSAIRGGNTALDSLAAKGVLHKEPFKSFYNLFDYTMDPEWLSLFRKHESEVRDIAAR